MSILTNITSGQTWVGVDIGGTKTAIVISVEPPVVLARQEFPTLQEQGPEHTLEKIRRGIRDLLEQAGLALSSVGGIGVSCGSPLDRIAGVIQAPPNLPTWVDVPITTMLRKEFGVPCRLENDANAGAVAEHRFGAGKGTNNMVFITMGTGLGAGVIANGHLYHGASDSAGEIGHVRLTPTGPVGYNKKGSVEGWASGGGMAQVAKKMVLAAQKRQHETVLLQILNHAGAITAKDVSMAAKEGDAVALRIIQATGRKLGQALAIVVDVVNPERIVIGGLAMRLGDMVLDPARQVIKREALPFAAASCEVVTATLGEQIGDVAALCVAMGLD